MPVLREPVRGSEPGVISSPSSPLQRRHANKAIGWVGEPRVHQDLQINTRSPTRWSLVCGGPQGRRRGRRGCWGRTHSVTHRCGVVLRLVHDLQMQSGVRFVHGWARSSGLLRRASDPFDALLEDIDRVLRKDEPDGAASPGRSRWQCVDGRMAAGCGDGPAVRAEVRRARVHLLMVTIDGSTTLTPVLC